MTYKLSTPTSASPEAFISVKKNRQKIYSPKGGSTLSEGKVYLDEGTEFQLELFNPTQTPVLAKISLNGKLISQSGIVLKPGQRIFLERFLDVAKKFKFETYEVENFEGVEKTIAQNGLVEISFYDEQVIYPAFQPLYNPIYTYTYYSGTNPLNQQLGSICNGGSGTANLRASSSSVNTNYCNTNLTSGAGLVSQTSSLSYCSLAGSQSSNQTTMDSLQANTPGAAATSIADTIETGRVEQGGASNQSFTNVAMNFNSWTCAVRKYQILPNSQKPVEVKDVVKNFCSGCGSRVKSKFKFCPNCSQAI